MKQLVALSGKGGTGKTSVTAALAELSSEELSLVIADADVDAANLELLLAPNRQEEHVFMAGQLAVIDQELCLGCGTCESVCRFNAIRSSGAGLDIAFRIDSTACEGCGACMYACPSEAIQMEVQRAGLWFRSETRFGPLFHARMFAGQENSGKLVTLVKRQASELASSDGRRLLLVDGPPGIGCPVVSSLSGADLTLLITEPTISGVHDLQRMLGTAKHFAVPSLVVINKVDINLSVAATLEDLCAAQGVDVIGRIPYDAVVTEAMVHGLPVTSYTNGDLVSCLRSIWERTRDRLFASEAIISV